MLAVYLYVGPTGLAVF